MKCWKLNLTLAVAALAIASSPVVAQGPLPIGQLDFGNIKEHANDVWTVEIESGQKVRFIAGSLNLDTQIEVRTPDGDVLVNDDCSSETLDSCIETTVALGGRHELRVSAFSGGSGGYWVIAQAESTGRAVGTLLSDRTVSAYLDGRGAVTSDGLWRLQGEEGQHIVVAVTSEYFDPAVRLLDSSGVELAYDDDSGPGLNAELTAALPATGAYDVAVTAVDLFADATTGPYTIRLDLSGGAAQPASSGEDDVAEVRLTVGELEHSDTAYITGEWYDEYTVDVEVGNSLVVDVESEEVGVYVVAISPSGVRSGHAGAARHGVNQVALEIDAAEPGIWRIHVTSATPAESGPYQVRIGARPVGPFVIRGTLEPGDAEGRDGGFVDSVSIPAAMQGCVRLGLTGAAGLRLRVLGPAGHHAESDSVAAPGGTVALDNVAADRHRVLVIGVPGQTGDYHVEVEAGCLQAAGAAEAARKTFGLFIGVSDYGGRASDLPRTADDARRLAGTLVDAGVLPAANAVVLTDRQATVDGVEAAVAELQARVGPEDTFVFFFSGHGDGKQRDEPEPTDPDGLDETIELVDGAVRDDELHDLLAQIEANLTLVVLDSCFSGGFGKDVIGVPGRMGIFSSEEDAMSGMPAEAGGYLSQFMMDAVAGGRADADGDGAIRAIELRQYLHERFRTDVEGSYDDIVWSRGPAYQHLQIDPGSVRPTDVIFRLQAQPVRVAAAQAPRLQEIIDASLEATGGREAMARIESVRQAGALSMSTPFGALEGSLESIIIPNQKLYQRIDIDVYERATGWNGVAVWESNNTQGVTELTGPWAAAVVAESSLHPFWDYGATGPDAAEFSRLADAELGGRNHHVVRVSRQGIDSQVFVDADTMLVSRIRITEDVPGIGTVTVTGDRYDYEEHGGVMWPLGNRVELPGVLTIDARVSVVEVNAEVDHSIFEKP